MANIPDDEQVEDIRRWHIMHRDTASDHWRAVDVLLATLGGIEEKHEAELKDRDDCHAEEIVSFEHNLELANEKIAALEYQLEEGLLGAAARQC